MSAQKWLDRKWYFRLPMKWRWLLDVPFNCGANCCDKLKKEPFHRFEKQTGRYPIIGTLAAESQLRKGQYVRNGGCNVFGVNPKSMPLSIWTEQDILDYIEKYNVEISEIYNLGARHTGCVGCGYGIQFANDNKFQLLYDIAPKYYNMVMNYTNNGVTYREAVRQVLAREGRCLPDEQQKDLFS